MKLASRLLNIQPSVTIAINNKAMELKRQGIDIIDLTAGQPDFPTPDRVKNAGVRAIQNNQTRYVPFRGVPELKQAIVEKLARDNDLVYEPDDILVSCGGKHSLYLAIQVLLEAGDEALICSPYWTSYPPQVELSGAVPIIVPTEQKNDFRATPEQLKEAITSKTRVLILNSPSNPSGTVYSKDELEQIAEIIVKHDLCIITDEIYEKLIYDGIRSISIASLGDDIKSRTVVINGVAKSYAMTGWRIGYAAGPKDIINAMAKIQAHEITHPASISQYASIDALKHCDDEIELMRREFERRRNFIVPRLNEIPGVIANRPQGAFYVFPRVDAFYGKKAGGMTVNNSMDLSLYLLTSARVATVPGSGFGDDRFIRLSFAESMELLEKGMNRLEDGLSKLHD